MPYRECNLHFALEHIIKYLSSYFCATPYLVSFFWDGDAQRSKVVVMDAADIAAGPLCRIALPHRVPNGFHATWVSAERLRRGY